MFLSYGIRKPREYRIASGKTYSCFPVLDDLMTASRYELPLRPFAPLLPATLFSCDFVCFPAGAAVVFQPGFL